MVFTIKKDFVLAYKVFTFIIVLSFLKKVLGLKRLLEFSYPKKKTTVQNTKAFSKNLVQTTSFFLGRDFGIKSNCLLNSLVYFHFLNKAGINARIHLGIEKRLQQLQGAGHAWVTVDGYCFSPQTERMKEKLESIYSFPE